jgi:hypothetical protein
MNLKDHYKKELYNSLEEGFAYSAGAAVSGALRAFTNNSDSGILSNLRSIGRGAIEGYKRGEINQHWSRPTESDRASLTKVETQTAQQQSKANSPAAIRTKQIISRSIGRAGRAGNKFNADTDVQKLANVTQEVESQNVARADNKANNIVNRTLYSRGRSSRSVASSKARLSSMLQSSQNTDNTTT